LGDANKNDNDRNRRLGQWARQKNDVHQSDHVRSCSCSSRPKFIKQQYICLYRSESSSPTSCPDPLLNPTPGFKKGRTGLEYPTVQCLLVSAADVQCRTSTTKPVPNPAHPSCRLTDAETACFFRATGGRVALSASAMPFHFYCITIRPRRREKPAGLEKDCTPGPSEVRLPTSVRKLASRWDGGDDIHALQTAAMTGSPS